MDASTIDRLESNFGLLEQHGEHLARIFRQTLETRHPEVASDYQIELDEFVSQLVPGLSALVKNLRTPESLVATMKTLGARHAGYGLAARHIEIAREVLRDTIAETLRGKAEPESLNAWCTLTDWAASSVRQGLDIASLNRPSRAA